MAIFSIKFTMRKIYNVYIHICLVYVCDWTLNPIANVIHFEWLYAILLLFLSLSLSFRFPALWDASIQTPLPQNVVLISFHFNSTHTHFILLLLLYMHAYTHLSENMCNFFSLFIWRQSANGFSVFSIRMLESDQLSEQANKQAIESEI